MAPSASFCALSSRCAAVEADEVRLEAPLKSICAICCVSLPPNASVAAVAPEELPEPPLPLARLLRKSSTVPPPRPSPAPRLLASPPRPMPVPRLLAAPPRPTPVPRLLAVPARPMPVPRLLATPAPSAFTPPRPAPRARPLGGRARGGMAGGDTRLTIYRARNLPTHFRWNQESLPAGAMLGEPVGRPNSLETTPTLHDRS